VKDSSSRVPTPQIAASIKRQPRVLPRPRQGSNASGRFVLAKHAAPPRRAVLETTLPVPDANRDMLIASMMANKLPPGSKPRLQSRRCLTMGSLVGARPRRRPVSSVVLRGATHRAIVFLMQGRIRHILRSWGRIDAAGLRHSHGKTYRCSVSLTTSLRNLTGLNLLSCPTRTRCFSSWESTLPICIIFAASGSSINRHICNGSMNKLATPKMKMPSCM
jgi:hypothetical protein